MLQPKPQSSQLSGSRARTAARRVVKPFFGLLDSVIMDDPAEFAFDGAVKRSDALSIWAWMARDLAADLIDPDASDTDPASAAALEAVIPDLLGRARTAMSNVAGDHEAERRLKTQMGGEETWTRLPIVLNALKCRPLLEKAQAFGRAINGIHDEGALVTSLQSMPMQDASIAALLMTATLGQVVNPSRLIVAATKIAGDTAEIGLMRAGYGPLVDAILVHAQNTIPVLLQVGAFADIDLICRAVDRFHRLIRSISGYMEVGRQGRWSTIIARLTKTVSDRLEPKLREVAADVNLSLRRRDGVSRLDGDRLLAALNGVYLMATIRDCRDSLALNEVFDETWNYTGQALEMHLTRNLEQLRETPTDQNVVARLDAGIKMAELRFSVEYAEVLRRACDAVSRRTTTSH